MNVHYENEYTKHMNMYLRTVNELSISILIVKILRY